MSLTLTLQHTSWSAVTNYSGAQQGRAAPVCTLDRFGQESVLCRPPLDFSRTGVTKTFIECALSHLIEIHVVQ